MNMLVLLVAAMFTAWGEKMTPETAWRDYPLYSDKIGITLKSVSGKPGERVEASYTLQDDDLYVRAIVESSESVTGYALTSYQHPQHKLAWTQPIRKK